LFPELNIGDNVSTDACIDKSQYVQYQSSLESRGVGYISMGREVHVEKSVKNKLKYQLKSVIIKSVESNFSEPYASIILGMAWGIKRIKGFVWEEVIRNAGVSYLFSVSGHQIFVITGIISKLSKNIIKRIWFLLSIMVILYTYGLISDIGTGFNRAFMMLLFINLAQILGRPVIKEIVIIFVFSLMLVGDPSIYRLQGFQLSMLATMGIIVFAPTFRRKLIKFPKLISEFLVNPIVVQMMIFPMILSAYGGFSPFGIITSSILSIFVPLVVGLGIFLPLISGFDLVSKGVSYFCYPILIFIEQFLNWIYKIPISFVEVNVGSNFVKIYYFLFGLIYMLSRNE